MLNVEPITMPTVDTGAFRFGAGVVVGVPEWRPLEGPQSAAYNTPAFETLYGGAAGGGKSDLLLGLARFGHRRALLLRRSFPDAERSLITRSLEFFGDRKQYNASKHVWNIGVKRIEIGHLEYEKDIYQYQGAAYDFIGFDELTQFTKRQYEYLFSRARTTRRGQRVRIIATSNPGGEGNDWVMDRWAAWLDETHPRPAGPGEVRYFTRNADGAEVETSADDPDGVSRTFIPAKLSDNPYLDDSYRKTLNMLPEPFRSQLLNGDWKAGLVDDAYQVIPRAWVKAAQARWTVTAPGVKPVVGVDVARGGDDETVLARRYGDWFAPLEKHAGKATPNGQSVAALIANALRDGGSANVDVIGVGASAYDTARSQSMDVIGVNFAEKSNATDKSGKLHFINKRAECYWRMREALSPESARKIALPPDPRLMGDLIAPRWSMQTNGIKIESKEDIKARLGRSPDDGDAVVLALFEQSGLTMVADPFAAW